MCQGTCPGPYGKMKSEKVLEPRQIEKYSVAFLLSFSITCSRHGFALGYQYRTLKVCVDLPWPTWRFDSPCNSSSYLMIRGPLPAWFEIFLILEQLWGVTLVMRSNFLTDRWWKQVMDARLKYSRDGRRHRMKAVAFEAQAKEDMGDPRAINWWQLLVSK